MITKIDGVSFRNMVDYAVRNLNKHCNIVNQLNVFPVPDGDTGTNMVTTIHRGLLAVEESLIDLPSISRKFSRSVVFEARGNSGVIMSQFLKGMAEEFHDVEQVDGERFIAGLERGVKCAYSAVANPVEGTMLTVLRDATEAVKAEYDGTQSVDRIVDCFVVHARISLENTPELLPVLKESGVVDSGGAGVVYLFEGMKKFFDGEDIESSDPAVQSASVDYDQFGPESRFDYGYCTELLLQLLHGRESFDADDFRRSLEQIGDSLVISVQGDKVRVHVHTMYPEQAFALCHRYGEFLHLKVENMSVQHTDRERRILCAKEKSSSAFSVVAVAGDYAMQKLFLEMGADVAICGIDGTSTKDYIDAFEKVDTDHIFVFPNSNDAILSAVQAKSMYKGARITVINSRSLAECYAALPAIDFAEQDVDRVEDEITKIITNIYVVSVAKRKTSVTHGEHSIHRNEFYSFSGKELIAIGKDLEDTVVQTIDKVLRRMDKEIITIFYKRSLPYELIERIVDDVQALGCCAEIFAVATDTLASEMSVSFE